MPRFQWDNSLNLGDAMIDRQHQSWVELLNRVDEACQRSAGDAEVMSCLTAMYLYANGHFFDEEGLMARLGYPDRARHIGLHREFVAKTQELTDACLNESFSYAELLDFMTFWLKQHITMEDAKIIDYRNVKGELES